MSEDDKRALSGLMERISKGDTEARDILANRFYRTVYCFIYQKVKSEEDARDLTQETFMRVCRPDFSVKFWNNSYLFQIAHNLCVDLWRKRKKAEQIFHWEAEKAQRYIWDGPETFNAIFTGLDETEEKLVILRYDREYSVKEIAKHTGIPTRTLDRRFALIKEKVRIAMDAEYKEKAE